MEKSISHPGLLYSIATPIGNLGDITYRAVQLLGEVEASVCEDSRQIQVVLQHYQIPIPQLIVYHAQSTESVMTSVLDRLASGAQVALVTDRGTPGISDPGGRLISAAVEAGITVIPIPGPTAVMAALQAAGVHTESFWYRGFIPHKKGRQTFLQTVIATPDTVVFYESPHRILKCLTQLQELGVGDRHIVVARELTKHFEEFLRGTAASIFADLSSRPAVKGEFVVVVDQA